MNRLGGWLGFSRFGSCVPNPKSWVWVSRSRALFATGIRDAGCPALSFFFP